MIDRYVNEALCSTGTRGPSPEPLARARAGRGSDPPAVYAAPIARDFDEEITGVFARPPAPDTLFEI